MSDQDVIKGLSIFFGIIATLLGLFSAIVWLATLIALIEGENPNIWAVWCAVPASWLCFLNA